MEPDHHRHPYTLIYLNAPMRHRPYPAPYYYGAWGAWRYSRVWGQDGWSLTSTVTPTPYFTSTPHRPYPAPYYVISTALCPNFRRNQFYTIRVSVHYTWLHLSTSDRLQLEHNVACCLSLQQTQHNSLACPPQTITHFRYLQYRHRGYLQCCIVLAV